MSTEELELAIDHHRAGRLQQAKLAYQTILESKSEDVDAIHGLGMICLQTGRLDEAVSFIGRAAAMRPSSMPFRSNLGMAYLALKVYPAAEQAFRQAIQISPEYAGTYFNLANALKEQKRLDEAASMYLNVIRLQPDHADALNNLGNCLKEMGRLEDARTSLARAIQLRPEYAEAYSNLSNVLLMFGKLDEAELLSREALRRQPNLGVAYVSLGTVLFAQKKSADAASAFRRATELAPTLAEAHENLGMSLAELGQLEESLVCFRNAVEVAPMRPEAWMHLANGLMQQRQLDEAHDCFRLADELQSDDPSSLSQWLFWQLYLPDVSLPSIAARHATWNARFNLSIGNTIRSDASPLTRSEAINDVHDCAESTGMKEPPRIYGQTVIRRPLRVGLVSADFGQHPIGMFTIRTVEAFPSQGIETVIYSAYPRSGDINQRFRNSAAQWREVRHLPDEAFAKQIAADRIDILIDLAGHSAGNRLATFARRAAPIQATWIGSEGTTGLTAMDFLIADERIVPQAFESFYCEQIVRLPISYVSWDPPAEAPAVQRVPALLRNVVTFGSFNNPAKYNDHVAKLWSQILHRVPGSRLILQSRHLSDRTLQQNVAKQFSAHDVAINRLEFRDWQPYAQLLNSYHEIDIALDPFPFGGGATTCEALWMGVPVVTLPGETFSSRHSFSYLSTIGLPELIAGNANEYVEIAVALAQDVARLSQLRSTLRPRMQASSLCDGQQCAQDLAEILRRISNS